VSSSILAKVLIVDDDKFFLETLKNSLEQHKFTVATAENGLEAIRKLSSERPDIILMDVVMPQMSGYAACQSIKKIAEHIPIILISGIFISKADIALGHQAGADGFVSKPFRLETILAIIQEKLGLGAPAPTSEGAGEHTPEEEKPEVKFHIVTCPDCKARFKIAEERLRANQFKFRCPKCEYLCLLKELKEQVLGPQAEEKKPVGRTVKKILVVDDTEFFRDYVSDMLAEAGYKVITAENGTEALEQVHQEIPDLVLTDLLLPGIHGFDLCKKIKSAKLPQRIPVIMMTGVYKSLQYQREAQEKYGADDFLIKPFEAEDLLSKIGKFL
jgi:predicted Zn finger-like uncharacterized protein